MLIVVSMLIFPACNNGEKSTNSEVPEDFSYMGNYGYISEKDDSIYFVDDSMTSGYLHIAV